MDARAIVATGERILELLPVELEEPGDGDVVVELEYSAISVGTEAYLASTAGPDKRFVGGYAPVGRVVRAGPAAAFAPGRRVTYFRGRPPVGLMPLNGGQISPGVVDAHRDRDLTAFDAYCVAVPDDVPPEHAAFAGISAVSYLAAQLARPRARERVAIIGQGIIGLFATQHFALLGTEVLAIDLDEPRLELARRVCGADHVQAPGDDLAAAIRAVWPEGADVVVDTTGSERVVEASLDGLRREGAYVFLGLYKAADFTLQRLQVHHAFRTYFPFSLSGDLVAASLKLMGMGALKVEPLISHRFPVEEVGAAFDLVYRRPIEYSGILLDWRAGH